MIADIKARSSHRSKIIEGQIIGLQKMIQKEAYCMDILTQSLAIQRSLGSLNQLVLENHLNKHVSDQFKAGESSQAAAIDELLKLYELHNIKGK